MVTSLVLIMITSLILVKIINKKINLKDVKIFIRDITYSSIDYIWIIIVSLLLNIVIIDKYNNLISKINIYKDFIAIILLGFIAFEFLIKYRASRIKYFESMLGYINIGVSVCILIEIMNDEYNYLNKWVVILFLLINLKELLIFYKKSINNKNSKSHKMSEKVCSFYEELFPSRKEQADSVIRYINSYANYEKFTLLIDGDWGTGKTSLIKGVEEKCKEEYSMIFIQPMLFDKKELLVKYFCEKLKDILSEGNIYVGKGSNVEKYLVSLLNLVNKKTGLGLIELFLGKSIEDFREIKDELQGDISKYIELKKIIVIVDDFDRVGTDTIKEILMFIKEVIDFEGISTILLMQQSRVVEEGISKEYLDKYIDKRIDLEKVELQEVVKTFIDWTIEEEVDDDKIIEKLNQLKSNSNKFIKEIKEAIKKPLNRYNDTGTNNTIDKNNSEIQKENEVRYEELIHYIRGRANNIRLIKRIIREFIFSYKSLQSGYEDSILLTNEDITFILRFILIKNIFIDEYNRMQESRNFYLYFNEIYYESNAERECISSLLGEYTKKYLSSLESINRYKMGDAILTSKFEKISYETKTENEKIIDKIDKYNSLEDNEKEFINEDVDSNEEVLKIFERFYQHIDSEFFKKGDYEKTKRRLKKVNSLLFKYIEKYKFESYDSLLITCKKLLKDYKGFEMHYILIGKLYNVIKTQKINDINKINSINKNIEEIRRLNLNEISKKMTTILNAKGKSLTDKNKYYLKLEELNEDLVKVFALDMQINDDSIEYLYNTLYKIREDIIVSKDFKELNRNYFYTRITIHLMLDNILNKMEKNIGQNNNPEEVYKQDIVDYIYKIREYDEFYKISIKLLKDVLINDLFCGRDLTLCFYIINKGLSFKEERSIKDILKIMNRVCDKAKINKHPNDYDYIKVQDLIIEIKNFHNEINTESVG